MKWKESDFKNGIKTIKSVLIYGADAGQVDELCDKAIEILQIDRDNLFSLDADEFRDKQDAIFAEACSPSMFGGQKMVIIDSGKKPLLTKADIKSNEIDNKLENLSKKIKAIA